MKESSELQLENRLPEVLKNTTGSDLNTYYLNWLEKCKQFSVLEKHEESVSEDFMSENLLTPFFAALSPSKKKAVSKGHDLDAVKRTVSSILELTREKILTEAESNVLIEYLTSKYVQHYFDHVINNIFDTDMLQKCTFRKLAGRVK
jgi:hypothetical protein